MALESMRRYLTPDEDTSLEGAGVVSAPPDPYAKQTEEMLAAMEKAPKLSQQELEERLRGWEQAAPGATAPIDPRATVDYLDSLQGKLAPADNLLPAPLPREKMTPVTTLGSFPRLGEKLSGSLTDRLAAPIPVKTAPPNKDVAAPTVSVREPVTSTSPAGKPDSSGKGGLPAPSSEGAGGDADEERNLYLARLIARNAASFGAMGAGKSIDTGAVEALGERLKQVQALRAKREERAMEIAREDEQSAALVSQYKSLAAQGLVPELPALDRLPPKQAAGLIKTYGSLPGLVQRTEKTKAEIPLVEAKKETEEKKAGQKDTQLTETERHNRAMERAAFLSATRAAKPAAEARGVKPEALTNRLKDLNAQTKPFQEIVSSLKEADAALSALGTGQISRGAKIASKIPLVGSSFVSTPELRAMQGQEGLKQSYQKLKTGLAAVGQELTSFENQFGLNWYADPRKAPLAVESLKQITQDALRRTQAPFGAGTGNAALDQMEVLSLLKNTGGLTADNPVFRPNPKLEKAAGVVSGQTGPTESQIAKLKARPDMAAEFDKKFGPGAAAKILGGP